MRAIPGKRTINLIISIVAHATFAACTIVAICKAPFAYSGDSYPFLVFVLIGCCLGFVLRPKGLRLLAIVAIVICAWKLLAGYRLNERNNNRANATETTNVGKPNRGKSK
jgi:uncharacterized membrane protein